MTKMKAQSLVVDQGRHTFIDKVKIRVADSERWAEAVNFGDGVGFERIIADGKNLTVL
jgi:hypothetical protein